MFLSISCGSISSFLFFFFGTQVEHMWSRCTKRRRKDGPKPFSSAASRPILETAVQGQPCSERDSELRLGDRKGVLCTLRHEGDPGSKALDLHPSEEEAG